MTDVSPHSELARLHALHLADQAALIAAADLIAAKDEELEHLKRAWQGLGLAPRK